MNEKMKKCISGIFCAQRELLQKTVLMIKSVIWLKIENSLSRNSSYNLYQNTKDTEMSLSLNFDVRYDDVFVTKLNHAD